jgi:hypothetical protein
VDVDDVARHADRIVEAIARRSEQDPGMTLDQVQQLLVRRVRDEADELDIAPRALMGASGAPGSAAIDLPCSARARRVASSTAWPSAASLFSSSAPAASRTCSGVA